MIIKKYKNRKYYCPERKKFIDQSFIIRLIMIEEEFIIVDNKNDDITLKEILKIFRKKLMNECVMIQKGNGTKKR